MASDDAALLLLDCSFPATCLNLDSLSPTQLAVVPLRSDDVDPLVQLRAYHEFLLRREEHEQGFDAGSPEPLFDVPLNFPIPADLSVLSATQLLLLQFNPRCTTHADVAQAAALFFRRADEAKAAVLAPVSHEPEALATLQLQRYWVEWEGGERSEAGGLALRVEDGGLTVARADERLFTLEAGHMSSLSYLTGVEVGLGSVDCTLVIALARLALSPSQSVGPAAVQLELGSLDVSDSSLILLRAKVAEWSQMCEFEVKGVRQYCVFGRLHSRADHPGTGNACSADARTSHSDLVSRSADERAPSLSTTLAPPLASAHDEPTRLARSAHYARAVLPGARTALLASVALSAACCNASRQPPSKPALLALRRGGPCAGRSVRAARAALLHASSAPSTAHQLLLLPSPNRQPKQAPLVAGPFSREHFYTRLFALLRAIAPSEDLSSPVFSAEEAAILSRAPEPDRLPVLPEWIEEWHVSVAHAPRERLALERIYRHAHKLDLAVERHVLLSSEYPALQSYARLVAKVIQTRDALREAFDVVLRKKLYPHRNDPRSYDPVEKLVVLVEQLQDNPARRRQILVEPALGDRSSERLIRSSSIKERNLGVGPFRRWNDALRDIVAFEQRAGALG